MFVRSAQVSHEGLANHITRFTPLPPMLDPTTIHGAELLNRLVTREAQIIAFNNDYRLLSLVVIPPLFLLLLMRPHRRPTPAAPTAAAERA
jgi:DHA2 family multidrug resistance protein